MGRMREPSLSLHGIEGAFSAAGAKTVIPASVSGKFSIRCVLPLHPSSYSSLTSDAIQDCSPADTGGDRAARPVLRAARVRQAQHQE